MKRQAKRRGEGRVGLSLRGIHRGAALEARKQRWRASKLMQDHKDAFHEPGSMKKS